VSTIDWLSNAAMREEMGKQGAKTALNYSWDRIAGEILRYYEEVANGGGEPRT